MARQVLLDTSFVIALENRDDPLHEKAKRLDQELLQERSQIALHWGILLKLVTAMCASGDVPKALV